MLNRHVKLSFTKLVIRDLKGLYAHGADISPAEVLRQFSWSCLSRQYTVLSLVAEATQLARCHS